MIATYQFVHVDWASRARRAPARRNSVGKDRFRSRGWSARDIVAEAMRTPGACPHVEAPEPPVLLYRKPLETVLTLAEAWGKQASVANGKKYRKNQPILANGVFSCPRHAEDKWPRLKKRFMAYLRAKYGDRLVSVIEHVDEAHPHLHFYLIPRKGEDFGAVHPGYRARAAIRAQSDQILGLIRPRRDDLPADAPEQPSSFRAGAAFRAAMKAWQDEIHEKVCAPFQFDRISPTPKRRVVRAEAIRRKQIAGERDLAEQQAALLAKRASIEQQNVALEQSRMELEALRMTLREREGRLQQQIGLVADREQAAILGQEESRAETERMAEVSRKIENANDEISRRDADSAALAKQIDEKAQSLRQRTTAVAAWENRVKNSDAGKLLAQAEALKHELAKEREARKALEADNARLQRYNTRLQTIIDRRAAASNERKDNKEGPNKT